MNTVISMLLQAFKLGFYGPRIVWVLPNWIESNWVDSAQSTTSCSRDQILLTIENALFIGQTLYDADDIVDEVGISGRSASDLDDLYKTYFNDTNPLGSTFRLVTYDTIWAAAIGLNITLTKLQEAGIHSGSF